MFHVKHVDVPTPLRRLRSSSGTVWDAPFATPKYWPAPARNEASSGPVSCCSWDRHSPNSVALSELLYPGDQIAHIW